MDPFFCPGSVSLQKLSQSVCATSQDLLLTPPKLILITRFIIIWYIIWIYKHLLSWNCTDYQQEGRAEKIWALLPVLSLSQDNDLEQTALAKIFKSIFRHQNKYSDFQRHQPTTASINKPLITNRLWQLLHIQYVGKTRDILLAISYCLLTGKKVLHWSIDCPHV